MSVSLGSPLEAALRYAKFGWPVVPVHRVQVNGRCSCYRPNCDSPGKHPISQLVKRGFLDATTDLAVVKEWWERLPWANVAVVPGPRAGCLAFDIDPRNGGDATLARLQSELGNLPITQEVRSGGGGRHLWFKMPNADLKGSVPGSGLELKIGTMLIAPPSTHPSGGSYEWINHPDDVQQADLPKEWIDWLQKKRESPADPEPNGDDELEKSVTRISLAVNQRNNLLAAEAFRLGTLIGKGKVDLDSERVAAALVNAGVQAGLSLSEASATVTKQLRKGIAQGEKEVAEVELVIPADIADEVLELNKLDGYRVLHHHHADWWGWNGKRYKVVEPNEIESVVAKHLWTGPSIRRAYATGGFIRDVLLNLRAHCLLPNELEAPLWLDCKGSPRSAPNTVSLNNGIMDISAHLLHQEGAFRPHTPTYFSPVVLPFDFHPDAQCERWLRFLQEVLPDKQSRNLIQEFFGYCLVFDTSLHAAMFLIGEGSNGKSTALKVLQKLIGQDNYSSVPLERFGDRFSLAGTLGKLANIVNEIGDATDSQEGILKNLISAEPMTFERKNRDPITAAPTARLIFATNTIPRFRDRSHGLWRRLFFVHFPIQIAPENMDRGLDAALEAELPGIFLWALRGLERLRLRGHFVEPTWSKQEKERLQMATNPARAYLTEECELDQNSVISKEALYRAYSEYCRSFGYAPLNGSNFGREINRIYAERVGETQRRINGVRKRCYTGIRPIVPAVEQLQLE